MHRDLLSSYEIETIGNFIHFRGFVLLKLDPDLSDLDQATPGHDLGTICLHLQIFCNHLETRDCREPQINIYQAPLIFGT